MRRSTSRLVALALAVPALAVVPASAALAHQVKGPQPVVGTNLPVLMSDNVRLVDTMPDTTAISGEFARTGNFFYTSSTDSISVWDTSDPLHPKLTGTLPNLVFENEAMTYGERTNAQGVLERFVLVGVDTHDVEPTAPLKGNVGGCQLAGFGVNDACQVLVIDVTDPTNPHVRSSTPVNVPGQVVTTSTHTAQCTSVSCEYAYVAGDSGRFSIVDLRDLDHPKQLKTVPSAAAAPGYLGYFAAGHYWDVDTTSRTAWHTGTGGTAVFDISDPANPLALNATNAKGIESPYNDFIHHNSMRPNGSKFAANTPPSLSKGNVVLVTEEDYANDGDEVMCDRTGTIQTWWLPDLDGATYRANNPDSTAGRGTIQPLDIFHPGKIGDGLSTPVGAFCSAHWFDYHQSGILAQGYYQQGVRFIDVRNPSDIKQYGYFTAGASEVWDAYWVPERNKNGVAQSKKTNIVYVADLVRGIDVLQVDVPSKDMSTDDGGLLPGGLPLIGAALFLGSWLPLHRRNARR